MFIGIVDNLDDKKLDQKYDFDQDEYRADDIFAMRIVYLVLNHMVTFFLVDKFPFTNILKVCESYAFLKENIVSL